MSTLNYTQYGLAPLIEVELEDGVAPLQFNVALKGEEGWVSLRYEQPGVTDHDYIAITENSIVKLFMAGIGPGLLLGRGRAAHAGAGLHGPGAGAGAGPVACA